jgi:hypothetical protein
VTVDERVVASVLASGIAVTTRNAVVIIIETLFAANRRASLASAQIRRHKRQAAEQQAER